MKLINLRKFISSNHDTERMFFTFVISLILLNQIAHNKVKMTFFSLAYTPRSLNNLRPRLNVFSVETDPKMANLHRELGKSPNCEEHRNFGLKVLLTYREVCLFSESKAPRQAGGCSFPLQWSEEIFRGQ